MTTLSPFPDLTPDDMDAGGKMDARSMSMSMSSVGKVVYESVHRGTTSEVQQLPETIANQRNNLVYCPSPYATTRVSLFFPTGSGSHSLRPSDPHQSNAMSSEQNCYDMPIIKPVGLCLSVSRLRDDGVREQGLGIWD